MASVLRFFNHVHLLFLLIETPEGEPEDNSTAEGDNGNYSVVPDQEGILRDGDEGLTKGSGYGAGKVIETYSGEKCQYLIRSSILPLTEAIERAVN